MRKIYRTTDRIIVKIEDLTFKLAPLSFSQKTEIHNHINKGSVDNNTTEILNASRKAVKYCVKDVEGLVDIDDNPYQLEFENEVLTDTCVDELLNMELNQQIITVCAAMSNGTPEEFVDGEGKPIPGVKRVKKPAKKNKGKKDPN